MTMLVKNVLHHGVHSTASPPASPPPRTGSTSSPHTTPTLPLENHCSEQLDPCHNEADDQPDLCSDTDLPFRIVTGAVDRHGCAPMCTICPHFYAAAGEASTRGGWRPERSRPRRCARALRRRGARSRRLAPRCARALVTGHSFAAPRSERALRTPCAPWPPVARRPIPVYGRHRSAPNERRRST